MAYMRGDPYIWSDGDRLHIWTNRRESDTGYNSAVSISSEEFKKLTMRHFAQLAEQADLPPNLRRVLEKITKAVDAVKADERMPGRGAGPDKEAWRFGR